MARPEKIKTPLGQRLSDARKALGFDERPSFAEALGIPKDTLGGYERGDREPSAVTLALYHARFGIDLNWLLTGSGSVFSEDKRPLDTGLLNRLSNIVTSVYKAAGFRISPEKVSEEAGKLYNELASKIDLKADADEVEAFFPWLEVKLRKRLEEATAEPGAGKRLA